MIQLRLCSIAVLVLCAGLGLGARRAHAQAAEGALFEDLVSAASPTVDLGTLLMPFLDDCREARREIDKARCRSTRAFLKATLPRRSFVSIVNDPSILTISEYDGRVRGFKLMVAGCLQCKEPVRVGKAGERRFVTLKEPAKDGDSLGAAVEVARAALSFDGVDPSKQWAKDVKPHLRAEFVFQPSDQEWSFGPSRGFAFKLLGARVFNHCTGEVVYSKPASRGPAEKYREGNECDGGGAVAESDSAEGALAAQLDASAINAGIAGVRDEIDQCLLRFSLQGTAQLVFVVPGISGVPSSVTLEGALGGTEAGACMLDAARKARFGRFRKESQKFTYPIRFRRDK